MEPLRALALTLSKREREKYPRIAARARLPLGLFRTRRYKKSHPKVAF
jgi:hypothetical protein